MQRTAACLLGVVLLAACDSSQRLRLPTAPNAPTLNIPAPGPSVRPGAYALSGTVTAAGQPVAGASVALLTGDEGLLIASTLTYGNGSYGLVDVKNVSLSGALVSVSKPEYFTTTQYVLLTQDEKRDFELESAVRIPVGQQIRSRPGQARCASLGYGHGPGSVCQRFAVLVPTSGTLEVTVTSSPASPFDATILNPDGTIGGYVAAPTTPLRLAIGVVAGRTYQVDVVPIGFPEFELTTALR